MQDNDFRALIRQSAKVEAEIMEWYKANVDGKTRLARPMTKEYDILCPAVGNVEVKEDKMASHTGFYAFETEDRLGNPSGIAVTTAEEFVIVDDTHVLRSKTLSLLFLIRNSTERKIIQMGVRDKEGRRALGYLIPTGELVYSPYVEVINKWF